MTLYKWSKTAASNSNADSTINWAEGQAPSSVNDSARAVMAAAAKYRDDTSGALTTAGTSTALTVTTNQVFDSLANMDGRGIRIRTHVANGAAVTLNVDGLGAKAIVTTLGGSAVGTGALLVNTIYDLVYSNGLSQWILVDGASPLGGFASGTVMLFAQTAAPTGWTKGSTHNDKALRLVTGTVGTGGSTAFTTVFASRTIAQGNLPNYTLPNTLGATITTNTRISKADLGAGAIEYACDAANNLGQITDSSTAAITGSITSGGSGTAMDFAVQYVDVILATKD